MDPGAAGLMSLDVHIPVMEVQAIVNGCVIIPVRALVGIGVLAM